MLPQYAMPITTVSTDPQRNHQSARDIRLGRTLPLVAGSSSFMNGTLTRLKKYNRPSQVMPPTKCNQRNSIRRFVWKSVGRLMLVKVRAPILKLCYGSEDCRWLAREMKPGRFGGTTWGGRKKPLGAPSARTSPENIVEREVEKRLTRPYCR